MVVSAIVFLSVIYLSRTGFFNKGEEKRLNVTYGGELLQDFINKDTDKDGILDWEESLWGTNPNKVDTNNDGIPDNVEIENLKQTTGQTEQGESSLEDSGDLTQTDKFSRELFSTIATLNQAGDIDQTTIDKLSSSLVEQIQNPTTKKIFTLAEINIINDNSTGATQNYSDNLESIFRKYPINTTVLDVLEKFIIDEDTVDVDVLFELNPIIEQTRKVIKDMVKMQVPQFISSAHLDLINSFQILVENVIDIKLYDTDIILSLSAISQYETNVTYLESSLNNLSNIVDNKLNN